jgi:hypothetical protein
MTLLPVFFFRREYEVVKGQAVAIFTKVDIFLGNMIFLLLLATNGVCREWMAAGRIFNFSGIWQANLALNKTSGMNTKYPQHLKRLIMIPGKMLLLTGMWISIVLVSSARMPNDNSPDIKAVRNFSRSYKDASDVKWESLRDGGYVCRFVQNGVTKRAIYNGGGAWLTTIAGYTADHLPEDVWRQVHSVYYDYSILFVNEINVPERPVAYIVQVQDKRSIRIVRIGDGEIDEIQEIETL